MINIPTISQSLTINSGKIPPKQSAPNGFYQTNTLTPKYTQTISNPKTTHTSWLYMNDVHGKMTNMERIYSISQKFDRIPAAKLIPNFFTNSTDNVSKFKVSSGDIILGANYTHNKVANQFMNWIGVVASALGNHELDITNPANMAKLLDNANYKTLAINVEVDNKSPLAGKIQKSTIVEKDGIQYGLIGIAPPDMRERVKMNDTLKNFTIANSDETIKLVQEEVKRLEAQGIKHIAVLSHGGSKLDKRLAQETEGIDVIFGAHTHELIEGIEKGKNLFYSKRGEPVIITQAGKDGENLGILNLDFDANGVIKKAQNNIIRTRDYNRPLFIKDSVEDILGKPEIIGKVSKAVPAPKNRLIENNPHGNLIADAMRCELGTDISILNAGNIRGSFSQGPIDTRLISDITPFEDNMMILNLSEKQIVDSIKVGLKSLTKSSSKPGILLVSGLKYKANKKGELLELEFIDKKNKTHKIDVNNPSTDKKYTVAADDFYATGGDGYLESNKHPDFVLQKFNMDKNKLACDYIKKLNQPIEIENDNRIQIVD